MTDTNDMHNHTCSLPTCAEQSTYNVWFSIRELINAERIYIHAMLYYNNLWLCLLLFCPSKYAKKVIKYVYYVKAYKYIRSPCNM